MKITIEYSLIPDPTDEGEDVAYYRSLVMAELHKQLEQAVADSASAYRWEAAHIRIRMEQGDE